MIQCALIGLGRIASTLEDDAKREKPATHAGVIHAHHECTIVAGCDILTTAAESFGTRWQCNNVYTHHRQMLANHTIDILHIATPPDTHVKILKDALACNIPVIILEKPVADSLETAQEAEKLAAENPTTRIIVNHERRYALQYARCREVITEMPYGRLLRIHTTLYMGRTRKLPLMLYDDGTHMADLVHYLTDGFFLPETGMRTPDGKQLYAAGISGEVPVLFEAGNSRDHLVFELDLSFEQGRITVGNGYYNEYRSNPSPFYEQYRSLQRTDMSFVYTRYFTEMFADALRCYKDPAAQPVSSLQDGVLALKAIEKILALHRT